MVWKWQNTRESGNMNGSSSKRIYRIDKDKFEYATQHIMNIRSTQKCVWQIKTLFLWFTQIFRSRHHPHDYTDWGSQNVSRVCSYLVFHTHNWAMFHSLISHYIATAAHKQCDNAVTDLFEAALDYLLSGIAFRLNLFMVLFLFGLVIFVCRFHQFLHCLCGSVCVCVL